MSESSANDQEREAINAYYTKSRILAETWAQMLYTAGVGPHAMAIAASHVVSIALSRLAEHDQPAAQELIDELAAGLLKFAQSLADEQAAPEEKRASA